MKARSVSASAISTSRVSSSRFCFTSMTAIVWLRNTRKYRSSRRSTDEGWTSRLVEGLDHDAPGGELLADGAVGQDHGGDASWRRRTTLTGPCGCSSAAEHQLPKLRTRVRFPSPAPATTKAPPVGGAVVVLVTRWGYARWRALRRRPKPSQQEHQRDGRLDLERATGAGQARALLGLVRGAGDVAVRVADDGRAVGLVAGLALVG